MTLLELRRLSDCVRRVPCDPGADLPPEVREYNASVTRFQELVVLVRNRMVLAEPGQVPAGADQVRALATSLVARRPAGLPGWIGERALEPAARAAAR